MAKATAICKCETCGKEFEMVDIKSSRREADNWEHWAQMHYTECSDCYKARIAKERAEETKIANAQAQEMNLPELSGSAKQVAWANRIRMSWMNRSAEEIEEAKSRISKFGDRIRKGFEDTLRRAEICVEFVLEHENASWWIDNRSVLDGNIMHCADHWNLEIEKRINNAESKEDAEIRQEAQEEMTVIPENKKHDGIVEIIASDKEIAAKYQKNDDFRGIVKGLGYAWNSYKGMWSKAISFRTGSVQDRCAELGSHLLNAGFAIRIADAETRKKAVSADYEPETFRWIAVTGNQDSMKEFVVTWEKGNENIYLSAKRIPTAKYEHGRFYVKQSEYKAIIDFANAYDFKFSAGAKALLEAMDAATVSVKDTKMPEYDEKDVSAVLDSSREVIGDLIDED